MLNIGIIDDGVGVFAAYYKLKQVISANFVCKLTDETFPLASLRLPQLYAVGRKAIDDLAQSGCDLIVISSITLSAACYKRLEATCPVPLFCCEAPVVHAATYTASGVLVCGDSSYCLKKSLPNVSFCVLTDFPALAEQCRERQIVQYLEEQLRPFDGKFDCIALAGSSMNVYKHCFARVCPNVRIFDSLDGMARKIRKKYKKTAKEEGSVAVINQKGEDVTEKYAIFLE